MTTDLGRRRLMKAAAALSTGIASLARPVRAEPRVVTVVARKFEFVPAEIHVKQGEAVSLQFTAPEVPMGVNLPDFKMRVDVVPGQPSTLAFTPDRVGSFTFVCDLFCGSGHEDMSGTLIVG
ncbi:MAG: cytochrome oxidase subunit periplasmic domain protein [Rhizobacter sp.]|nr:cytochrome oxidase subunit periplasmic domain protein [Rhizobacter sp.]